MSEETQAPLGTDNANSIQANTTDTMNEPIADLAITMPRLIALATANKPTIPDRYKGKPRDMVCRRRVSKGVTGAGMSYDPATKGLIVVYDMDDKGSGRGHKCIPVDGLYSLKMNGQKYMVEG